MACNAETASYKKEAQHIQYKPHAPVYMTYSMPENIKANTGFTVLITLKNDIDVDDLIVKFHTNKNLKITSDKKINLGVQPASQSNSLSVNVISQNEGRFYINVSATLLNNGKQQSRSFAIPVNVGDVQNTLKANGQYKKMPNTGGIISMPAVEPKK